MNTRNDIFTICRYYLLKYHAMPIQNTDVGRLNGDWTLDLDL